MNRKMLLAIAGAALAGGIATTSAQAAPVSGHDLIGTAAKGVETVHYDYGWNRRPWWYYNRWDRRNNRWWWWQKNHRRDWWRYNNRRDRDHDRHRRRDW